MDDVSGNRLFELPPNWPQYKHNSRPIRPGDEFCHYRVLEVAISEDGASVLIGAKTESEPKLVRFNLKRYECLDVNDRTLGLEILKAEAELSPMEYCRRRHIKVGAESPDKLKSQDLIDRAVEIARFE